MIKQAILAVAVLASLVGISEARAPKPTEQLKLSVLPTYDILKAGEKQSVWVRVGVTGFELKNKEERVPVNLALVLDRSGSMQGDKIAHAREAAINAIGRLRADDIISVITYDDTVNVLVPATKLTDKEDVIQKIRQISVGGSTALFAGVSKGAAEVRKFFDEDHVNRVILLSDGKANVGPDSPSELGALGESLRKENISVSSLGLGLGYNEDLMVQLASHSGGNHEFIESAAALTSIFDREFNDVTSVVAQDIKLKLTVSEGIRPVRVLGNDSEINGQTIHVDLTQVYSRQDKHVVVELEVPAFEPGESHKLCDVNVTYRNMFSSTQDELATSTAVTFDSSQERVEDSLNEDVMRDVVVLIANEQNKLATQYLDMGDKLKCVEVLNANGAFLQENAKKLDSPFLDFLSRSNTIQATEVEKGEQNRGRKVMRDLQQKLESQQAPAGAPARK